MRWTSMMAAVFLAGGAVPALALGEGTEGQDGAPSYGVPAPTLGETEYARPLPEPYDASRDAAQDVADALSRAEENGTFVLVDFGGNWCPDCRILSGMMKLPVFSDFIDEHYELVYVDVGRFDRNLDVARSVGIDEVNGVPTVAILTPSGALLNASNSGEWTTSRQRRPQEALDYFARYAPKRDAAR